MYEKTLRYNVDIEDSIYGSHTPFQERQKCDGKT